MKTIKFLIFCRVYQIIAKQKSQSNCNQYVQQNSLWHKSQFGLIIESNATLLASIIVPIWTTQFSVL